MVNKRSQKPHVGKTRLNDVKPKPKPIKKVIFFKKKKKPIRVIVKRFPRPEE